MAKNSKDFEEETYGRSAPNTFNLSRKQIKMLADMADKFKEQDVFTLRINYGSGIGPTVTVGFDLDITDVDNW